MLRVSDNGHFLVREDGSPFFWLGDTGWHMLYRLGPEDMDFYLGKRAAQGYTIIQAWLLPEYRDPAECNPFGEAALHDEDPTQPNEVFFTYVDEVVHKAARLGLHLALLPTWGDHVVPGRFGPVIFNEENARVYGEWVGRRYRDADNIVWVLGGDRAPVTKDADYRPVWRAMAAGIKSGDNGRHLMSYHICEGPVSTGTHLHDEDWLDLNMLQSGHSVRNKSNYTWISEDYARTPAKPCLDSEPNYEDHAVSWKAELGWFDDYDVRKLAYGSVFAGACGHTYGCMGVWQFMQRGRPILMRRGRTEWRAALDLPGACQMQHLWRLMESRPYVTRVPDQALITGENGDGTEHIQATRNDDGAYAFVYLASGKPVTINTGLLSGSRLRAWWFDPRTGRAEVIGEFAKAAAQEFAPPLCTPGIDYVLVLDDTERGFGTPGAANEPNPRRRFSA